MFFSSLNVFGVNGLPLEICLNAFMASCFSFLKGINLSGLNVPDNLFFNIATFPQ